MRWADAGRASQAGGVVRRRWPARQAEFELRVRPARPARRTWHGDLPGTREMLALPCSGLGLPASRRIGKQGVQAPQRGQGRDRLPRRPHRAARDGIEHPDRDLLEARDGRVHERAARRRAGGALDDLLRGEPDAPPRDAKRRGRRPRRPRRYYGSCGEGLYNTGRPHSSLGYRPPAPEVVLWPAPPATIRTVPSRPVMH